MTSTETIRLARHLKEQIELLAEEETDEQVKFRLTAAAGRLESAARCATRQENERVASEALAEVANLTGCEEAGCKATFRYVAERQFPNLCIDHAADRDRGVNGWTPWNSVD